MPTPANPTKRPKGPLLWVAFLVTAVLVAGGLVVWWIYDPLFGARPDAVEARQLTAAAHSRPLTDDEFDRAVDLLDSVTPAAQISAVTILEGEAVRTSARRERVITALERVQRTGSPTVAQAAGIALGRLLPSEPAWQLLPVGTEAKFRGLSVVSAGVVWASGTGGTVVRTTDGGEKWDVFAVPGATELDFRDVEAFGPDVAYVLAAGDGEKSRIYKTTDGGKSWKLLFSNPDPKGFFDAIAFWDERNGIALGDPVGGKFQLLHTTDGKTWQPLKADMPEALIDEGAFAASGTCLITHGENGAWFVTGGPNGARVFHSTDRGKTWGVKDSPLGGRSKSAGLFGIAFRDEMNGVIVGGDYTKPDEEGANGAVTADGGKTWVVAKLPFRSGVTWAGDRWVTVGTSGADVSGDGKVWRLLDHGNWNSVGFAGGTGWAVGPAGRVARWK